MARTHKAMLLTLCLVIGSGCASGATREEIAPVFVPEGAVGMDHISLFQPVEWTPVNRRSMIVWSEFNRPYLIVLERPCRGLQFSEAIGVRTTNNTLYAKFDSILVEGFPCQIESIYAVDRDQVSLVKEYND